MARIEINDLPVDEELSRREAQDLFGGGEPENFSFRRTDSADLGGRYTLNYSGVGQKVNKVDLGMSFVKIE